MICGNDDGYDNAASDKDDWSSFPFPIRKQNLGNSKLKLSQKIATYLQKHGTEDIENTR